MPKPKFDPLQGLKDLDKSISTYLGQHMAHNAEKQAGYGPNPQMEGAGVINRPNPADLPGAWMKGFKKKQDRSA